MTKLDCFYCGAEPSNTFPAVQPWAEDYIYQGIDRIDSSLGYDDVNSRPCCWICNRMKGAMTEQEFLDHIRKVASRR